ncbi:CRP/FNR family transcriptional regulator [Pseudaminobacter salicylatoxidans]|uniref:CRP/FNR family transcriptional regulator n=1 Tax=Pseudaminobacter salicylatoxidans TaxID=93369 RepID=A0A316C086_PSESE|nr:Crp/Fnr family transcriptional regulator [Pseudaminobacter salicylatoxidans]PWJ81007.1 CRP/FNR family transcriptional regulator [Pseudaminobacter salicylatoxidans]
MNVRQDIHNSDIPVLCRSCEVRHKGVCGALNADQLVTLSKHSSKYRVAAGEELVADSEHVSTYSNVLAGVVKLSKMLSDGRQQIVGLQFAPDFLGRPFRTESSLNAVAATEVSLCSFPASVIERMMEEVPELERRLLKQTLNELDEARDWMLTLGRKTAAEKVASFLHLVAVNIDPEASVGRGPVAYDLPLTRADIADFLGLTIETVSRQMTKLRKEGVIEIEHNRQITIPDIGRLGLHANI